MQFFTEQELQSVSVEQLMDYLLNLTDKKDFHIDSRQVDALLYVGEEITEQDLKPYLKDFKGEGLVFPFPYGYERDMPIYENTFRGAKRLPSKDYFWHIRTAVTERTHGLVKVVLTVEKEGRNATDPRWTRSQIAFKQEKHFYYDYQQQIYKYVDIKNKKLKNIITWGCFNNVNSSLILIELLFCSW